MQKCACDDSRARGLFQFYGANRTGRWAGRLVQLQNLPRNYIKALEDTRTVVRNNPYETVKMFYDNIPNTLSELIRTAFIAKQDHIFCVADFSAIEARLIAWLAKELWRIEIFKTHGKIYEASAAMMFNVPFESITKGSDLRQKGKVAELSLGYQGAVGAMKNMGGERMGLNETEMKNIVDKWRKANPAIVKFWKDTETKAILAIKTRQRQKSKTAELYFDYDGKVLTIELPSGRKLFYQEPRIGLNKWNRPAIKYKGLEQTTKRWCLIDTYGGKLVENIVQAVARDLLAYSMLALDKEGFTIVMHVHDEAVCTIFSTSLPP